MNAQIASEIQTEQDHGRQKYAGRPNNFRHDDCHTDEEWAAYIADHNERAKIAPPMERRQHLIKVAGLAISAVESIDRKSEAASITMDADASPQTKAALVEMIKCAKEYATAKIPEWNYLPTKAWRGTVIVGKSMTPTWWCAGLEGTRRKCVKVDDGQGDAFFIDDENGHGSLKVFELGGGPDSFHASIPVDDPNSFVADPIVWERPPGPPNPPKGPHPREFA